MGVCTHFNSFCYNSIVILFNGNFHAKLLEEKIAGVSADAKSKQLAIVQVGNNAASEKYVAIKAALCARLGVNCYVYNFLSTEIDLLEKKLVELANDTSVGSIIVQLPLPDQTFYPLLDLLPLEKDIDASLGSSIKQSPIIRAFDYFLNSISYEPSISKTSLIVGCGELVGKPIASYLKMKNIKVTIEENYIKGKYLNFELVVLSAGVPKLVDPHDIAENSIVVDFGSSVVNGKTVGDLDLEDISKAQHLSAISPSPGGMGPLVVRFLVMNHLRI